MKKDNYSYYTKNWIISIVFETKYIYQINYGKYKQSIEEILRLLCERKGVGMIELMQVNNMFIVSKHST